MELTEYHIKMILAIIATMAVSFYAVHWVYFKILKIAKKKNIVDNPDARKLQKTPIPVMGGIAVFFGVVVGILAARALPFYFPTYTPLLPIICAMTVMLYVGAMDDIVGLTARNRFIIEILTILAIVYGSRGCIDTFNGLWGVYKFSWWIGVPLTIITGVGIINAVNMIDGVNGLSSGLCMVCSAMFGILFFRSGDMPNALTAAAMSASLLPFFIHNVFGKRSRMFIGDAGTMVMGVLMTWFVICILRSDSHTAYYAAAKNVNLIALVLAIMCVPVFDTLRVMTVRIYKGKSPFSPDKTHLHHVFINIGVSHSITALIEITFCIIIVSAWAVASVLQMPCDMQLYLVIMLSMFFVWGSYIFLRHQIKHHTELLHRLTHVSITTHLGHTDWWQRLTLYLDAPEEESDEEETEVHSLHMALKYAHKSPREESKDKVLAFMKGKAEVFVDDLKKRSGAAPEFIDSIIEEGIKKEAVVVVKSEADGTASIISLSEEFTPPPQGRMKPNKR